MDPQSKTLSWQEWKRDELRIEEKADLARAVQARRNAYGKYSNYTVGAVIRMNDDKIYEGWNAENIVHASLHAEESAIARIVAKSRETGLQRIVVVGGLAGVNSDEICSPCGSCRQKLFELLMEGDSPDLIMAGTRGNVTIVAFKDMLPFPFYPELSAK